jgi:hypothetical protein
MAPKNPSLVLGAGERCTRQGRFVRLVVGRSQVARKGSFSAPFPLKMHIQEGFAHIPSRSSAVVLQIVDKTFPGEDGGARYATTRYATNKVAPQRKDPHWIVHRATIRMLFELGHAPSRLADDKG